MNDIGSGVGHWRIMGTSDLVKKTKKQQKTNKKTQNKTQEKWGEKEKENHN